MLENGCSLVGEERGDENPPLNTMHTLWVREHNRIADNLRNVNPNWRGDLVFQHSRKIVGAIFQHIVYNEFVPLLANLKRYTGYKSSVNPSISNAFANAAFRFGHTLIPNSFARLNKNFDHAKPDLSLQESFRNILPVREDGIEPLMFGLLKNQSQDFDTDFAFGIARRLFVPVGSKEYRDLTALNIQRGRDHGLPTYGAFRKFCKLESVTRFSQLRGIIRSSAISKLKRLYSSPNEIDLFAAGSSEIPLKGKLLGPTFSCLVKDQFERTRDGDRFFYQRRAVFSQAQLNEIKKVTFARVLCDNLKDIVSIQRDVFQALNNGKKRVECGNIRGINFRKWFTGGLSSPEGATTVKPQPYYRPGNYYRRQYSPGRYYRKRFSRERKFRGRYSGGRKFRGRYSGGRKFRGRYSRGRKFRGRYSRGRKFRGRYSRGYHFG
ncbi:peroxidasin homolog pxn-2-like [Hydractinia symbiolongicarpus]|uniref:peroxidasin homolog pxn-2-like n=1 Tax=Hydractinia symbiolongicarpus TaxID=13093 RepID=UPI00254C8E46|nr:peroxidasin homolog pxn-2-like [Hydractinia symbiolongicarpus]